MGLWNILFRRKKFQKPAKITLTNIHKYLQGSYREFIEDVGLMKPDSHIREQGLYRITLIQEKSPECIKEGACKVCGCTLSGLVLSDPPCEGGCYPTMMDKAAWNDFKITNKIEIDETTN